MGLQWSGRRAGRRWCAAGPGIELAPQRLLGHAAGCATGARPFVGAKPGGDGGPWWSGLHARAGRGLDLVFSSDGFTTKRRSGQPFEQACWLPGPIWCCSPRSVPRQGNLVQRLHRAPAYGPPIGGAAAGFDVWAADKKRAPAWMEPLQIECCNRLYSGPAPLAADVVPCRCFLGGAPRLRLSPPCV